MVVAGRNSVIYCDFGVSRFKEYLCFCVYKIVLGCYNHMPSHKWILFLMQGRSFVDESVCSLQGAVQCSETAVVISVAIATDFYCNNCQQSTPNQNGWQVPFWRKHLASLYPLAAAMCKFGCVYPSHSISETGSAYNGNPLSSPLPWR